MARLRRQIIISIVLGAVTTISVAWIASARTWLSIGVIAKPASQAGPFAMPTRVLSGSARTWFSGSQRVGAMQQCVSWTDRSQARAPISAVLAHASGLIRVDPTTPTTDAPPPFWSLPRRDFNAPDPVDGYAYHEEVAAGWPLPALRWTRSVIAEASRTNVAHIGAWRTPAWARGFVKAHDLPLAPILPGFGADALAFAIGWFGLLFGYPTYRRLRRHAAGHCPRCGYNLRGDLESGCPECGWNRPAS